MGETVRFQSTFMRVLGVCTVAFSAVGVGSFVLAGDWAALGSYGPWLGLLGVLGYAAFWAAYVEVSDGGVTLVNVLRTIRLPWPAIRSIEGKFGLRVESVYGPFTAWAASAPSGRERRHLQDSEVAAVVRGRFEELQRGGHLQAPRLESETADVTWHWPVIVAGTALGALAVLGPLLL